MTDDSQLQGVGSGLSSRVCSGRLWESRTSWWRGCGEQTLVVTKYS